jgi:hypothetical protein
MKSIMNESLVAQRAIIYLSQIKKRVLNISQLPPAGESGQNIFVPNEIHCSLNMLLDKMLFIRDLRLYIN